MYANTSWSKNKEIKMNHQAYMFLFFFCHSGIIVNAVQILESNLY